MTCDRSAAGQSRRFLSTESSRHDVLATVTTATPSMQVLAKARAAMLPWWVRLGLSLPMIDAAIVGRVSATTCAWIPARRDVVAAHRPETVDHRDGVDSCSDHREVVKAGSRERKTAMPSLRSVKDIRFDN